MWTFLAKIYLLISSIIGNQHAVGNSTSCGRLYYGCCWNEYNDNGKCKECPHGTYGVNCSRECESGYYGRLCLQECDCELYYCDHRFGCQECPPGTFGLKCSGTCPKKHYGRLCREECNCTSDEYCDPTYGCLQKHKATPTTTSGITTSSDNSLWKNISFAFFGFIFAAVVVGGVLCLKPRLKDLFRYPAEDAERSSGVRPELAADDAEAASGTAHEYLQEEAVGNADNVYADLRTSKMVDSAVVNATGDSEPVDDGNRHRKLNYAHIPEENYDLCTLEAVSEENTMHDYACVPKNFQYSILSLKRNVDPSLLVDLEAQPKGPVDDAYDLIDICGQTYNKVQTTTLLNLTQVCV